MTSLFALKYGSVPPSRSSKRYKMIKKIGDGSYGDVYKCQDLEKSNYVAVKVFRDKFLKDDELARGATPPKCDIRVMAMREIKLLRALRHPNLVNLIEYFRHRQKLHLVFEFCEETVLDVIEKHKTGLPRGETIDIIGQTLLGLAHCHLHFCVHRDIKPENLLITKEKTVKICDFGFARVMKPSVDMTDYVATRWYRAPELLVGDTHYGPQVDVWAVGCVLAELATSKPLWPGESDLDQLYLICKNLGEIIPSHLELVKQNKHFKGLTIANFDPVIPIEEKVPVKNLGKDGMEVLVSCFEKDPSKRMTCEQLLGLPYFNDFRKSSRARSVLNNPENRILPQISQNNLSNSFNLSGSYRLKFH